MAEQINEQSVAAALESAFGNAPAPAKATAPAPAQDAPVDEPAAETAPPEEAEAEPVEAAEAEPAPEPEPEFEIEVNGKREIVKGKDQVRELLQKGRDYVIKSEFNARAREALTAQAQQIKLAHEFNQVVFDDISQLRAMDAQLEHFSKIDWSAAIDSDFTNAMKLQEQRNALREARAAKAQEIASKHQAFQLGQAQAVQQKVAAENAALLAKLPEWSDSETRTKEQQTIARNLADYGFNEAEIASLQDHRMVLVARDAMKWRALQAEKANKVQQVRTAPPVVKPGTQQGKEKADARSELRQFRDAGRKGEHRTQEQLLEKMLGRAFK